MQSEVSLQDVKILLLSFLAACTYISYHDKHLENTDRRHGS